MKARKTPVRTCVACGRVDGKRDFVRVVRDAEGYTRIDPSGKAPGRGAYLCPESACFEAAVARRRLAPALRVSLAEEDVERLRNEFETTIDHDSSSSRSGR